MSVGLSSTLRSCQAGDWINAHLLGCQSVTGRLASPSHNHTAHRQLPRCPTQAAKRYASSNPLTELYYTEAVNLVRSGYGRIIADAVLSFCRPVFWFDTTVGIPPAIIDQGSVFFVDAGKGPFGVTAAHVVDGLSRVWKPTVAVQIGEERFPLLDRVLTKDRNRDVATFALEPGELQTLGASAHRPRTWPPLAPQEGRGVFFAGYRAVERQQRGLHVDWGMSHGLGPVGGVHDDRLRIQFQREYWVKVDGLREPEKGEHWGGASGGPVIALYEGRIVTWGAVGVISQFSNEYEILTAGTIGYLQPDGTL